MSDELVLDRADLALFLDVDGTLLEIAETPDAVQVPPDLPDLLYRLCLRFDGALALVSGRDLRDLDTLFAPYRFAGAGVHGCERREASGCVYTPNVDPALMHSIFDELSELSRQHAGVLVEHKQYAVAVHYRLAPGAEPQVREAVQGLITRLGSDFVLQRGKCVYELKPAGYSKGSAVRVLSASAPFANRYPVFIGDDITDEDGFAAVNDAGGLSIRVGDDDRPSLAVSRVATVSDVHVLLQSLDVANRVTV